MHSRVIELGKTLANSDELKSFDSVWTTDEAIELFGNKSKFWIMIIDDSDFNCVKRNNETIKAYKYLDALDINIDIGVLIAAPRMIDELKKNHKFTRIKLMKKKKFVINFISGPSVGKSLMSALVYAELKIKGYKTEYVQEYAKTLVWKKQFDILNNQYHVSTEQYNIIKALETTQELEIIVVDGALLLGIYYNENFNDNVSNVIKTRNMILKKNAEFNNIYIYLERNVYIKFEKEGRMQNEEESKHADVTLYEILHDMNLPFQSFLSHKDSVKDIVSFIEKQMIIS